MRILIIDDSKTSRNSLEKIVKNIHPNCEVIQAENGKDGFKLLQTNSFNHIFTDLDMGDMNVGGMAFIYKLLGNKILSKKKITITSSSISEEVKKSFSMHPNISFVKKTSPDIMEKQIRDII